jgi:ATP citrate (pro-S)-lyase
LDLTSQDLVSSLAAGLLTIGPRFGGALDDAAKMFTDAHDSGVSGADFVKRCKNENKLIMGIGHRIKSLTNPDVRVVLIKEYAQKYFKSTAVLDFALQVRTLPSSCRGTSYS